MDELHRVWGQNIERCRKAHGMTQTDLADAVNVTQQTVSRWEAGTAAPRDRMKLRLSAVLKVEVRMLFPLIQVVA